VNTEDTNQPTPETLAAYVDGELTPGERSVVERWLRDRPEARAELDAHQRLNGAWQASRPGEPDEATWSMTLAGIANRLPVPIGKLPRQRIPLRWLAGVAAAAAVAALVWIFVSKPRQPELPSPQRPLEIVENPLPIASPDDVVITSVWGPDEELLLVGHPPLRGPMTLADPGDVQLEEKTPVPDTEIKFKEEPGATPMIVIEPNVAKEK
jgi:hypothetical protein